MTSVFLRGWGKGPKNVDLSTLLEYYLSSMLLFKVGLLAEKWHFIFTGKFFSEALTLASTNPQYDKRLLKFST